MGEFGRGSKRFWRPLIGVVVAYTVAAQSLLIALGGFGIGDNDADQRSPEALGPPAKLAHLTPTSQSQL